MVLAPPIEEAEVVEAVDQKANPGPVVTEYSQVDKIRKAIIAAQGGPGGTGIAHKPDTPDDGSIYFCNCKFTVKPDEGELRISEKANVVFDDMIPSRPDGADDMHFVYEISDDGATIHLFDIEWK